MSNQHEEIPEKSSFFVRSLEIDLSGDDVFMSDVVVKYPFVFYHLLLLCHPYYLFHSCPQIQISRSQPSPKFYNEYNGYDSDDAISEIFPRVVPHSTSLFNCVYYAKKNVDQSILFH